VTLARDYETVLTRAVVGGYGPRSMISPAPARSCPDLPERDPCGNGGLTMLLANDDDGTIIATLDTLVLFRHG
jgi:hypothetical protein